VIAGQPISPTPDQTGSQTPAASSVGTRGKVLKGFSLFQEANENSLIKGLVDAGAQVDVLAQNPNGDWLHVKVNDGEDGWVMTNELYLPAPIPVTPISVGKGYGARSSAWQVYFTSPSDNPNPATDLGIEVRLANSINKVEHTLDIAAFEFDNKILVQSVLSAKKRNVVVRIVTDDENGLGNPDDAFEKFIESGIPVVTDDRSALMHDKFMILDGKVVWTGSWNYTEKGTYQYNDNALAFEATEVAALYQNEFNQMFEKKLFRPDAPASPLNRVTVSGIPVEVYFSPHDDIENGVLDVIRKAKKSIRFMTFSFTDDKVGALFIDRIQAGVVVSGIFELLGSVTPYSQLPPLFCAKANVLTRGDKYFLHHKVIILDDSIVITGSTNYSKNGFESNNENTIIIYDPALAAVYNQEFDRQWAIAQTPTGITCP